MKLCMCCAGLADANGYESAPQSASAQDGVDTKMTSVDGWAEPGTTMGSWGQGQDDDGIEWEPADNAENVEPGTTLRPLYVLTQHHCLAWISASKQRCCSRCACSGGGADLEQHVVRLLAGQQRWLRAVHVKLEESSAVELVMQAWPFRTHAWKLHVSSSVVDMWCRLDSEEREPGAGNAPSGHAGADAAA